jgi:hypothetical protein
MNPGKRQPPMLSSIDIAQLIRAAVEDRARCRFAGIAETDANAEAAAYVTALANRLRDRLGAASAMRMAFAHWDSLEPTDGEARH